MIKEEFAEIWCANAERVQVRMSPVAREHAKALNRQVAAYQWEKAPASIRDLPTEGFGDLIGNWASLLEKLNSQDK